MPLRKLSVITCTYNPTPSILTGLVKATRDLKLPIGFEPEFLLIDNNSDKSIIENSSVKSWVAENDNVRVIKESNAGLSNARIRGLREASGEFIFFFDDDNRPYPDYLVSSIKAFDEHDFIGVFGPGHVNVKWMEGGNGEVQKQFADAYQEHHQEKITYALDFGSPKSMPYGTGMIMRKEISDIYLNWFDEKKRSTTGRIGNSLASGEDIQICLLAMNSGWAVGRHPGLKIDHVIEPEKAQWNYLARLQFGISSSRPLALKEALPDRHIKNIPSDKRLAGHLLFHTDRKSVV